MDGISGVSNLSNWTLSLIVGLTATLKSGSQKNIVGELPFSDLLLLWPTILTPGATGNETVLISKTSKWSNIIHKSFVQKGLLSLYIPLSENTFATSSSECHKCQISIIRKDDVKPNMFYGLLNKKEHNPVGDNESANPTHYVIVHEKSCIEKAKVDPSSYQYLDDRVREVIGDMTNRDYLRFIAEALEVLRNIPEMDTKLISCVMKVMETFDSTVDDRSASEMVDRVLCRIELACKRYDIEEIRVPHLGGEHKIKPFTLVELVVIGFGIRRAIMCSDIIYNQRDGIVIGGYNIGTAHEILADITQIPSEEQMGFSRSSHIETSQHDRMVHEKFVDYKTMAIPFLEILLTTAILYLSKIGPLLSMYVCRQSLAPYRESILRRGSSMRWTVSDVRLYHTGTSRDDWLISIVKADNYKKKIWIWSNLLVISCVVPFVSWGFWSTKINANPDPDMQRTLAWIGVIGGVSWLMLSMFTQIGTNKSAHNRVEWSISTILATFTSDKRQIFSLIFVLLLFVIALFVVIFLDIGYGIVYNWIFEIGVGIIWLGGEIYEGTDVGWILESTSFFMMGLLSAIRLA